MSPPVTVFMSSCVSRTFPRTLERLKPRSIASTSWRKESIAPKSVRFATTFNTRDRSALNPKEIFVLSGSM
ncbi:hypothetical protein D3C83_158410 [compost metagenome]